MEFLFSISDDYEKKMISFLSPSQEMAGLPLSLCVWYSVVNQFTIGSLGGTKDPLCSFRPLQ